MIDLMELAEKGKMPDSAVRAGIKKLLRDRLKKERKDAFEDQPESLYSFIDMMEQSPVAVATETANKQHYELPSAFFQTFMGPHLKYSCGYWPTEQTTLAESEEAMLELTCRRAGIADGMDILDLGCGWGSLSLWMADRYPNAKIVALSNSRTQKQFIDARGMPNLEVVCADINTFQTGRRFDRVVSVEMFEHMRNWPMLLRRINGWLHQNGKLFVHIFVHRNLAYLFNDSGEVNWMAEHFFKEGMMPSESLMTLTNLDLVTERMWRVNGSHYARTLRAWLDRIDRNRVEAVKQLDFEDNLAEAGMRFGRWRIFFMACEELFGFNGGKEWYVAHYLLGKR